MKKIFSLKVVLMLLVISSNLFAADDVQSNLNFIWLGIAAAMVMFMQLGFIALEAGFTRAKNAVNVTFKGTLDLALGAILFFCFGYAVITSYSIHYTKLYDFCFCSYKTPTI